MVQLIPHCCQTTLNFKRLAVIQSVFNDQRPLKAIENNEKAFLVYDWSLKLIEAFK